MPEMHRIPEVHGTPEAPRALRTLAVGPTDGAVATEVLTALRSALDGSGPALRPLGSSAGTTDHAGTDPDGAPARVPEEVAVVLRTSGSTGRPREVMLDAEALLASARATHARVGGPGRWVLALPLGHVAGVQVLTRSVVAGLDPVVVPAGGFDPVRLAAAVAAARPDAQPVHTALVPTQLHRVVAAAQEGGLGPALRPLLDLTTILLGGAGAPAGLLDRAHDLGLPVVTTYGMTETCGGCVYDGTPLDGVSVRVGETGEVLLAGPVLARGHLGRPGLDAETFTTLDDRRWLRTRDLGALEGGVLRVLGRLDDVLVTGGVNVAPAAVEAALEDQPGIAQVCVVGVPDEEWGQVVVAVVVPGPSRGRAPELVPLREAVSRTLGAAAAPRHLVLVDRLPERGPGKVDRAAAARLAADHLRGRARPRRT
jgi:O-succinylbenzoic acid--CoA ligase